MNNLFFGFGGLKIINLPRSEGITKMLDDEKMRELIHTIVDVVRNNTTVDWQNRDDVRAKLRLTVKKILMRYGYPPDLAKLEADKVLAQSENLAAFFAGSDEAWNIINIPRKIKSENCMTPETLVSSFYI